MAKAAAVVSDLFFASKISGAGHSIGVDVEIVPSPEALLSALDGNDVGLVMVDMEIPDGSASMALKEASTHASKPTTLAFYPHVRADLRESAEQSGADVVVPRSQFNTQLPQLLRQYCLADG